MRALSALREQGYEGPATLVGDEVSLPHEGPPLSKGMEAVPKPIRPPDAHEDAGIERRFGTRALSIGPGNRTVRNTDGTDLVYEQLLLATGARARFSPGLEGCLTLRMDTDAARILARMTPGARIGIIGGGFIDLELAATARKAGADVTVFEAGPRLLARAVPAELAEVVQRRHDAEGVEIRVIVGVACADHHSVTLADGTELTFDVVMAGVGVMPNMDLAVAAGLSGENGIVVGSDFRTSDRHIFAAGECCNFDWQGTRVRLEICKAAQDQGAHVAAAMLGGSDTYSNVPWLWSDQYDPTLQVEGLCDQGRSVQTRESEDDTSIVFQCDVVGWCQVAAGIGPGNAVAKGISILEELIERGRAVDARVLADP